MVMITCPWCTESTPLTLVEAEEVEAPFTCADCGTSIAFVEEPSAPLDLAA